MQLHLVKREELTLNSPPALPQAANEPPLPPGRYKVVRATKVFQEPRSDAAVLARLSPGKKVKVVGGGGDYARVESTRGRPPGYISHNDLAPIYRETKD